MVDGFNILDDQWDPAGTYPDAPFVWYAQSIAKNPETEDVYISDHQRFSKWTQATNTWTPIFVKGLGRFDSWQFHPSLIDARRNQWVHLNENGPRLQFVDLTTYFASEVLITGPLTLNKVEDYSPLVHDLDNDRYVTIQGTSMIAIDPQTGVSTIIGTVPRAVNGVQNRFAYFQALGGMAYLPEFSSNILFTPTR